MSEDNGFIIPYEYISEEEEEKKKKRKKKPFEHTITIKGIDNHFIEELKKLKFLDKYGIADIIVKNHVLRRERFEGVYWNAVMKALQFKRENPNSKVKVIIKK